MIISDRENEMLAFIVDRQQTTFSQVIGRFGADNPNPVKSNTAFLLFHLRDIGFILLNDTNILIDWPITPTFAGTSALNSYRERLLREKRQHRKEAVRYWITTTIAVVALAISILADLT